MSSHLRTRHGSAKWLGLGRRLTLKHRETHGCVVSTVATDALVLKHQAISIHILCFGPISHKKYHAYGEQHCEWKLHFWKKWPSRLGVNRGQQTVIWDANNPRTHCSPATHGHYMHQWIRPSLFSIRDCLLHIATSLSQLKLYTKPVSLWCNGLYSGKSFEN